MSEELKYISLAEAAKLTNYSQDYISLLCRQGKLKAQKLGRNWVTTREWVRNYVDGTDGSGVNVVSVRSQKDKDKEDLQASAPVSVVEAFPGVIKNRSQNDWAAALEEKSQENKPPRLPVAVNSKERALVLASIAAFGVLFFYNAFLFFQYVQGESVVETTSLEPQTARLAANSDSRKKQVVGDDTAGAVSRNSTLSQTSEVSTVKTPTVQPEIASAAADSIAQASNTSTPTIATLPTSGANDGVIVAPSADFKIETLKGRAALPSREELIAKLQPQFPEDIDVQIFEGYAVISFKRHPEQKFLYY